MTSQAVGYNQDGDYLRQKAAGHARELRVTRKKRGAETDEALADGREPKPSPQAGRLARGADDDRVAAEVKVVVAGRRDDGRRDGAAGREQERGQSAARKPVHRRLLEARAARARRGLTRSVLAAGRDLLHGVAGAQLHPARLRG